MKFNTVAITLFGFAMLFHGLQLISGGEYGLTFSAIGFFFNFLQLIYVFSD